MPLRTDLQLMIADADMLLAIHLYDELVSHGAPLPLLATNAVQALDVLERVRVQAAVIDPLLAGDDASPVIKTLRERSIPTVILSGLPPEAMPRDLRDFSFVRKPFHTPLLVKVIEDAVEGRPVIIAAPRPEQRRTFAVQSAFGAC
jgi:DNA-binding NtrC family response regulator